MVNNDMNNNLWFSGTPNRLIFRGVTRYSQRQLQVSLPGSSCQGVAELYRDTVMEQSLTSCN